MLAATNTKLSTVRRPMTVLMLSAVERGDSALVSGDNAWSSSGIWSMSLSVLTPTDHSTQKSGGGARVAIVESPAPTDQNIARPEPSSQRVTGRTIAMTGSTVGHCL